MADALVLLSGGVDSAVCLYLAVRELGPANVTALTFDWGQRAALEELKAAAELAESAGAAAMVMTRISFPYGGLLTDDGAPVPLDRTEREIEEGGLAPTFFPGRNLVMLSYAFGLAGSLEADAVYFGPNSSDAAGYPDCRPDFVEAMQAAGNIALGSPGIRLVAPLIEMSKVQIVTLGEELGVPWGLTFSCYAPVEGAPCGRCDSCLGRRAAFEASGLGSGLES